MKDNEKEQCNIQKIDQFLKNLTYLSRREYMHSVLEAASTSEETCHQYHAVLPPCDY
jgi:hypothetical protein